ncbi:hypothetical protein FE257_001452 [Aspergillus nanangensis]|uniref:Nonribosomal peptide synthetase nanA n=2 Tax=Aspergillus nanangensis TaxID=2582783 RepID=NANA_ASPNN|nr:RecName: Full=Nonribosomal peptide synthetase nanA; AltName: Full=Nanangelenin A biosynthesis cluster protein A [Aspergillus nanangensis]KAF9884567.1 hypothetical protein FE257_001452 [Aspergillus nanangensis]QIQ51365.1 hypothetical protein FE257_001452 [Aspergillus nanangensis]
MSLTTDEAGRKSICLFPAIVTNTKSANKPGMQKVALDPILCRDLNDHDRFQNRGELQLLLSTAWTIVLHRFAEANPVHFAVVVDIKRKKLCESWSVEVRPRSLVSSLLDLESWTISTLSRPSYHTFNTAVFIRDEYLTESEMSDVNIVAHTNKSQITVNLVYRCRHLSAFHAENLMSSFSCAMQSVLREPHQPLGKISLCSLAQQQQISRWQNQPLKEDSKTAMWHRLAEFSARQPLSPAVQSTSGYLTYADLDELSSRMAVCLQDKHRVKPGDMVLLCVQKTPWAIVAMLAINKTGGCFVPCDPTHPVARRQVMATRCQARLAVVSPGYEDLLARIVPEISINPEPAMTEWRESFVPGDDNRTHRPIFSPSAPAYCFFTSGSTGEPKGCIGSHSALAALAHQVPALRMSTESRVLQFAKFGFGISFIEIFCTLAAGGTVCILSDGERLDALPDAMNQMRVNWALLTPTVTQSLVPEQIPGLGMLFLGGEAPDDGLILRWKDKVSLFQVFGTTEMAGVTLVSSRITSPAQRKTVGFGANARVWLCDVSEEEENNAGNLSLAPIGAVGELVIGGPSLGAGYLGDPQRTHALFLELPTSVVAGFSSNLQRVYKTGDLVRYNHDGSLSYIGRRGTQVKLRGQRLELEEVECHIIRLLAGTKTWTGALRVIALVIDPSGQDQTQVDRCTLAAFILMPQASREPRTSSNGTLEFLKLREQDHRDLDMVQEKLRDTLPPFMVPQIFLALVDVPRTATGKVDRNRIQRQINALPYQDLQHLAGRRVQMLRAQTDIELKVHALICDVLQIQPEDVSMLDDFFQLGGNSMTAITLVSAAKKQEALKLAVADVFKHPVLADLARSAKETSKVSTVQIATQRPFMMLDEESLDLNELKQTVVTQCNIGLSSLEDAYPCTPLQEGMMALTEQRRFSYRAKVQCHLQPEIDLSQFRRAWERVVVRNEILRTRLVSVSSQGVWQVVLRGSFAWDDTESQADEAPMGLGAKLVRGVIISTRSKGTFFILTIHHAICDLWAIRLLLDQVWREYTNVHAGTGSAAPNRFSQFVRYVRRMRNDPASEAYWKGQFAGLDSQVFPELPQPNFIPSPDDEIQHQISLPVRISETSTLSNYIRLAWAMVISHYTATDDVVFGEILNGRGAIMSEHGEDAVEHIVGPTLVSVPRRVELDYEMSVSEALSRIQEQRTEMIPFEQVGLQYIQRYSPETEVACMFQSHIVVQSAWNPPGQIFQSVQAGASITGGFASYAIGLECRLSMNESRLGLTACFDSRVVSRPHMQRLLNHLHMVLESMIQDPYQRLKSVPRVSSQDLDRIYTWNVGIPTNICGNVHESIRAQARKTPLAPAIDAWDGKLNFNELEHHSNQAALELQRRGLVPGDFVPLLFERSMWTPVAMIAVNKAGAAFVPMDTEQPLPRLQAMAKQVKCTVIVCSDSMRSMACQVTPAATVIPFSNVRSSGLRHCPLELQQLPTVTAHGAMYAAFTSGSTGTPKGVVIEHGSYCVAAQEYNKQTLIDRHSRVLQFASYSFDAHIGETISTLMAGACVCIPSDQDRQNALAQAASSMQITHAMLTPAVARLIRREEMPSLRTLTLMGEAMRPSDYAYWAEKVRLFNGYGPTECTVAISCREYRPGDAVQDIGWPRAAGVWITDPRDYHQLMPMGAVGELLLEGPPVARGYLNNPEQTAKAFISRPRWRPDIGHAHRIYRTGDLVRYTEDKSLQYVGRIGDQMKIRGQRIERGEVESQLRRFWLPTGVEMAVDAVLAGDNRDRVCLVAFIEHNRKKVDGTDQGLCQSMLTSPDGDFSLQVIRVETQLQQHLPRFMVPVIFVPIYRLPHMLSGKIDRPRLKRELQAYTWEELRQFFPAAAPTRPPSTDQERALQDVWAHVLQVPASRIGVDDNFFHIGGDSVTGMQAVAQARTKHLDHSLADIFRYKTIAEILSHTSSASKTGADLANDIGGPVQLLGGRDALEQLDVSKEEIEDIYPCAPVQQGILLVQARKPAFYHVAFSWEVTNSTVEKTGRAIEQIIARHAIFRTCFLQPGSNSSSFFQVVLRCRKQEIPIRALSDEIHQFPGDFQPSARVSSRFSIYYNHGNTSIFVRLDISHALWDGGPIMVVQRELDLGSQGQLIRYPEPSLYRNYIAYIARQDQEAAAGFWTTHLKDMAACHFPSLLTSDLRGPDTPEDLNFELRDYAAIRPYCRRINVTVPNFFCLVWAMVLRCVTLKDQICFGNLVSGRDLPLDDVLNIAGPMINLLPCRIDLSNGKVAEILQQIYSDYAASLSHQTFPIANLRSPCGRSPMAQFDTQLSIRRADSTNDTRNVHLCNIQSWDPHESRVNCYVILEDTRTQVNIRYWKSTMSTEQAALVRTCFCSAVSQLLDGENARVADLALISAVQRARIWGFLSSSETIVEPLERIWAEVLNRAQTQIGGNDDFFRLGGDSILAVRMVSLARKGGIDIRVADVFKFSTIYKLARLLQTQAQTAEGE